MPKQVFPLLPGYDGRVYSDDSGSPEQLSLDHLAESFRVADLLKRLGHDDAAECIRPVRTLAGFKPAAMIEQLHEFARVHGQSSCIACINADKLPELIWHPAENGVNQLVRIALAGGHVLGFIGVNSDGSFTTNTVSGPDRQLSALLLNCFGAGLRDNPQWIAAEQILSLYVPEKFESTSAEMMLDRYSELSDRNPIDIHSEIITSTETVRKAF